jgi:hypothetical protein
MPAENTEDEEYLSSQDIKNWADREIKAASKAFELKKRELTEISQGYSAGRLTAEEADEMHSRYYHRWGESLPGVIDTEGFSDEQILAQLDKSLGRFTTPKENAHRCRELSRKERSGDRKSVC